MLGSSTRSRALMFLALGLLVLTAMLWRMVHGARETHPPASRQVPHRADAYEGSSGMGADGFGGYPSRPDAP